MSSRAGGPSRRAPAEGGRPFTVRVSMSGMELALVTAAAARARQATAAWLGEAGVRVATYGPGPLKAWEPVMRELMVRRAELMDARRVLRIAGGNLNDVARHANSTGGVHAATRQVVELVERTVARVDSAVAGIDELVAAARRELLRSRG